LAAEAHGPEWVSEGTLARARHLAGYAHRSSSPLVA
jgi:hypothetical protein